MEHDIFFQRSWRGVIIKPRSVHGMLWLQTHFTAHDWPAFAEGNAIVQPDDAAKIANDADLAGLAILFP